MNKMTKNHDDKLMMTVITSGIYSNYEQRSRRELGVQPSEEWWRWELNRSKLYARAFGISNDYLVSEPPSAR